MMAKTDEDVQIVYMNEELVVINKPCDVAMDGDRDDLTVEKWANTSLALQEFRSRPLPSGNLTDSHGGSRGIIEKRLKFVHQLDYATSGLLCLAFSKDMASRLAHCFEMRYTRKEYLAVVYGHVDDVGSMDPIDASLSSSMSRQIEGPIAYDDDDPNQFRMKIDPDKGKSASTRLQVIQRGVLHSDPNVKATKVLLLPGSGRRHQLRVHCASIGHPIVGDSTYATQACDEVNVRAERMMLHAWRLLFHESVEVNHASHKDRVEAKKKRRRETLKLEQRELAAAVDDDNSCTVFATADPFQHVVVEAS